MNRKPNDAHDRTVSDQAIRWVSRLHADDVSSEDRHQFEQWRKHNRAHNAAYEEMEALWRALDAPSEELFQEVGEQHLEKLLSTPEVPPQHRQSHPSLKRHAWQRAMLAVAAAVLIVFTGAWFTGMAGLWWSDYRTAKGEQQTVLLADGSTVVLNTDSALSVHFSEQTRAVTLDQGEAFFTVARDANRPFVVTAGNGTIRVTGTAFNVHQHDGRVTVTVMKGSVDVVQREEQGGRYSTPKHITAGQQISYGAAGWISSVGRADVFAAAAWQRGQLVFTLQPLAAVIDEVNRYRAGKIFIIDPRLRARVVSGVFETADPDGVLRAIENTLAVKSLRLTNYLILLYQ